MSSFGNSNNNYRGGGNNYRGGGGRSRGGRSGRSGGRGGRGGGRGGGGAGGGNDGAIASQAMLRPCRNFATGNCSQPNCHFAHIIKLYGTVQAGGFEQPQNSNNNFSSGFQNNHHNQQKPASVTDIAVWENQGTIKIFTGSHDGCWRLWNTAGGSFVKEFENNMNGKVQCIQVVNNFLFCGFEAVSKALPSVSVGMVHAWNLQQPNNPPMELQLQPPMVPYCHNQCVTALIMVGEGASTQVVSGSRDGSIRIWGLDGSNFKLQKTLSGHAREVTGLVLIKANNTLWSCGTDGSIRIWNLGTGECQYIITSETPANGQAAPAPANNGQQQGVGHSHAVTSLVSFDSPAGTFVLSGSLDCTVKAWNGATGACVASEMHDDGVVCLEIIKDQKNNPLLLIGGESGSLLCRNLVQTPKVAAFGLLFCLSSRFGTGHSQACKCITPGPAGTFYSGGADGNMMVFQLTGDLGLQ